MKIFFLVIALLCLSMEGFGMIETLNCDELILNSELIVIGRVIEINRADSSLQKDLPPQIEILNNKIEIEENLSDSGNKKEIVVITLNGFEDDISFEKETRYLLFLAKDGDNYIVFNSPQGAFIIGPDGTLFGMINLGVSLQCAKKKINQTLLQKQQKIIDK